MIIHLLDLSYLTMYYNWPHDKMLEVVSQGLKTPKEEDHP